MSRLLGRMAERMIASGPENRKARKGLVGSNPTPSASLKMRGLALATLFLGLCLIHRDDEDVKDVRTAVFFVAVIIIIFGL
jgi:hypothetical protein